MAKIALVIGIGVAAALTGGLAAAGFGIFAGTFAGGSILGGVLLGGSIGLSVGKFIGSLAFPGHSAYTGPRLADQTVSSSANGTPIPFGYGSFRIGGQIIWSSGIKETTTTQTQSSKGGPSQTSTTYSYTVSFAAAFCEGPAGVTRIWGDSKIIYDATSKGAVSNDKLSTGIGNNTVILTPRIYPGNATQNPDPTIQASEGVNSTPAFRGTCYILYEDFPLFDFGNRLPNIRGECTVGTDSAFLKDIYPPSTIIDPYAMAERRPPSWCFIDQINRVAMVFDDQGMVVQRVDLLIDNSVPLNAWQASTFYITGEEILDSNGNVQCAIAAGNSGGQESGTVEPTWTTVEGDVTTGDGPGTLEWVNIGAGPEAIPVTAQGVLNFKQADSDTYIGVAAQFGAAVGVDTLGNIWNVIELTTGTGTNWYALRYDPRSLQTTGRIKIPGFISSIQFFQNKQGVHVVAWTINVGFTGKMQFYDAHTLAQLCGDAVYVGDTGVTSGNAGICFDADGVAYTVLYNQNPPYKWGIMRVDPRGGANPTTTYTAFTAADIDHQPVAILWNPVDNTLILPTFGGYLVKVDIASMTVAATSSVALLLNSQYAQTQSGMWPSGQVPTSGKLYFYGESGGLKYVNTVDPEALALDHAQPINSWFTSGSPGAFLWHSYDIATNSLVVTLVTSSWSGFTYRLYLDRQAVNASPLDEVVADILERSGMLAGDIDTSALSAIEVLGYPVARNADAKSIVSPLTQAYFFDLVESDFKVKAVLRGGAPAMSAGEADLGLLADQFEVVTTYAQENDLPKEVQVLYADPELDYQVGKQSYSRHARVVQTKNKAVVEVPLTLDADAARQIAFKALRAIWDERNSFDLKLWRASYLQLDPTDGFEFTYNGDAYIARITKISMGQGLSIEVNLVSEDARNYVSGVAGAPSLGFVPTTLSPIGPSILFLFDLPLLQDIDASPAGSTGFYFVISAVGKGWPGGILESSVDNAIYKQVGFAKDETPFGYVSSPLPAPRSPWDWDDVNTVDVTLVQGSLSSTSDLNVLNGANAAIYGDEVIQFGTATLNADGSYTLSHLLRGRRGTEDACGTHISGEVFIPLNVGIHRNVAPTAQVGVTNYYKAVTVGGSITGAQSQTLALTGADLKPYAPAQVGGVRDNSNNFALSWVRRTRLGGEWLDGTGEVPLNEQNESYDLEIMRLDFGGKPVTPYSIAGGGSPAFYIAKTFSSGGGAITACVPGVNPFSINYKGTVLSYLGDVTHQTGADVISVPTYVTVHDPTKIGEGGGVLTYSYDADDAKANDPDYIFVGIIHPSVSSVNPSDPGGSDAVARTVQGLVTPSYFYTAANNNADFYLGSILFLGVLTFPTKTFLRVRVYQNSAAVGRGFPADQFAVGRGLPPVGGSFDAGSINGVAVLGVPTVDGQVLTYVAANSDLEWVLPPGAVARTTKSKTTGSLANNAAETGAWDLGSKTFLVLKLTSDRKCRVQLYSTAAGMSADAGRGIGTNPTAGGENEVILDVVLDSDVSFSWIASPALPGSNVESSPTTSISYRITNLSGSTSTVACTVTVVPIES